MENNYNNNSDQFNLFNPVINYFCCALILISVCMLFLSEWA